MSKIDEISEDIRKKLKLLNTYNDLDGGNKYTSTHTRALSDSKTPSRGKGTGEYLSGDAGDIIDKEGDPNIIGSGRKGSLTINKATWGYSPDTPYKHP